MPTPEVPIDQRVIERPSEVVSETLTQAGITSTPANVKPVLNDKGQPMISPTGTTSGTIQLPSDQTGLMQKAKGSVANAATWLAKFLLRLIAKEKYANTTDQ